MTLFIFSLILLSTGIHLGQGEESHRLGAEVIGTVHLGATIQLRCTVPNLSSGDYISQCLFHGPRFREGNTNGTISANTCSLELPDLEQEDLGTYDCTISRERVPEFQRAFLSVIAEVRVQDIRLPTSLIPQAYHVYLIPYIIPGNFTIEGRVVAELAVLVDTNSIVLHAKDMVIFEDLVTVYASNQSLIIEGFGYDMARDYFIIYLQEMVPHGSDLEVEVKFQGNLNDDLSGFYRSSYVDSISGDTKYLALTQFQATDARKAFPCMDEPALKAVFHMHLGRTESFSSAGNMPIALESVPVEGKPGYVWDVFEPTPRMSSYLTAFIVSEFKFREGIPQPNGVLYRIWARPDAFDQTEVAADYGPRILSFYEDYFQVPFPLPKQDMGAMPDLSFGAMENWGLVLYRESALLYQEGVSSLQNRETVAHVVAHELAHMWFGDLVTMGWWTDLWLNEGFASYVEYIGSDLVEPDNSIFDRFVLENTYPAFHLDALPSAHPVRVEVNHPDEINELFDTITYAKGPCMVRMMNSFLSEKVFKQGLTSYLREFEYDNALQDDLWNKLTLAGHSSGLLAAVYDVKSIMDTWTLQAGFPVVTATRNPDNYQLLQLEQERFLDGQLASLDDTDQKWWIPISYSYAGGDFSSTINQEWMKPSENGPVTIQLHGVPDDAPVILNIQEMGYYRVNYDKENWLLLSKALQENHSSIHRVNRAQIMDDALSLAKLGYISYEVALPQTEYLNTELDYIPWSAASGQFSFITSMMSGTPEFPLMRDYLLEKVVPLYGHLGYSPMQSDTYLDILLRSLALGYACGYDLEDCVNNANDQFQLWSNSADPDSPGSNPIDVESKSTVYCTVISNGNQTTWDFFFERFSNSINANEQGTIAAALGCSSDAVTLKRYLDLAMDPTSGIRKGLGQSIVSSVSSSSVGNAVAWEWMQSRWSDIRSYYDTAVASPVAKMVLSVTRSFNTGERLAELRKFYQDNADNLGTAQSATESAIDATVANIAWMEDNFDSIVEYLMSH